MIRMRAALCAVVVLAAGAAGCTGGTDRDADRGAGTGRSAVPVARACADGTFTWTDVEKRTEKLTGVSTVQKLGKDGGKLTLPLKRVAEALPSVRTKGPAVSPAEVLFSLGKKTGEIDSDAATLADVDGDTWTFTDVDDAPPRPGGAVTTMEDGGRFVTYAGVREASGTFRYTCDDGRTTTGRARHWTVDVGGVLSCDKAVGKGLAHEAARRSCRPGDTATKKI
ncbi:hypothetical protein ACN2WE_26340 [Streptomyces sp. cg28]|uniref:hypothetical protein n=1 Tax=Streptomyces sp. cg28 TaxID=3403457 RepID=UPI003B22792A